MINWAARKLAIKAFFQKVGLVVGGLPGFFLSLLADRVAKALMDFINKFLNDLNQEIKNQEARRTDEKNQKKYEEVLQSETKTKEDIKNATTDFLNGRK
jgi:hypothetical protein